MTLEELQQYNAVSKKNFVFPQYDLTKKETGMTLYFNSEGEVIIVGTVDNYIFWLSVTKTEDMALNEEIFNRIDSGKLVRVSYLHKVLAEKNMTFGDLEKYYMVRLKRSHEQNMAWETPFGHYYGKDQAERNGSFFARDVKGFVNEVNKWCEVRECGGMYADILKSYADTLNKATEYDTTVQTLQNLLKAEDYLCISEREEVRRLYVECCARCSELYNRYMTEEK